MRFAAVIVPMVSVEVLVTEPASTELATAWSRRPCSAMSGVAKTGRVTPNSRAGIRLALQQHDVDVFGIVDQADSPLWCYDLRQSCKVTVAMRRRDDNPR